MMTKDTLRKQLTGLGLWEIFAWKRELEPLAALLAEDEPVLAATSGVYRARRWVMVATGRRYLFVRANLVGGGESFELKHSAISGCTGRKGLLFGRMAFQTGEGVMELRNVPKRSVPLMVAAVEMLTSGQRAE